MSKGRCRGDRTTGGLAIHGGDYISWSSKGTELFRLWTDATVLRVPRGLGASAAAGAGSTSSKSSAVGIGKGLAPATPTTGTGSEGSAGITKGEEVAAARAAGDGVAEMVGEVRALNSSSLAARTKAVSGTPPSPDPVTVSTAHHITSHHITSHQTHEHAVRGQMMVRHSYLGQWDSRQTAAMRCVCGWGPARYYCYCYCCYCCYCHYCQR
jgi:hypothetical protein